MKIFLPDLVRANGALDLSSLKYGMPTKYVCITGQDGSGKTNLRDGLAEWLSEDLKESTRIPLLMKTFFLGEKSLDENIAFFEKLKTSYQKKYDGFIEADKSQDQYSDELQDAYKSMFWGFTISYGRRRAKMIVEWCDECLSQLEEIRDAKRS